MLHLLSLPLVTSFLALAPASEVAVIEAAAPKRAAVPAFSLSALSGAPELRLGERLAVTVQLQSEVPDWAPFLTRFDPSAYRCAWVWGDEQWLWIEDEYDAPVARVFARRGTFAEALLDGAKPHDRLELEIVVREMQAGAAWIEVVGGRWTEQQTPEGSVLHAIRAMELIEREGWALAVSELTRALRPNLPGHVRRELETIRERCVAALEPK